jgi:hypothetical protein
VSDELLLTDGLPPAGGGAFDAPGYVAASARHTGTTAVVARARGTSLALLRGTDGALRTPYGYPHARGELGGVDELADALIARGGAWLALAPFGGGAALAAALARRCEPASVRPICVAEPADDELATFDSRSRRAARTARKRGGTLHVEPLGAWFGGFYRAAMDQLAATDVYRFDDAYFAAMAELDHYVVRVDDAHGVAAAMLWLVDREAAWYHLGGRRTEPEPVVGAMNLCTAGGLAEAGRRGAGLAVLGGGRGAGEDDPLFAFKRQMASAVLTRPIFELPVAGKREP